MESSNESAQQQAPKLYTELFRPQTLEQAVILPRIYEQLAQGINNSQSLLFYGSPGSGKTTLSRIMAKQASDVLEINASLENGIDTIRDKVMSFASSNSLFGGKQQLKVVLLEECDGFSASAWASLRATIEQFYRTTRFIANCNYIEKIPDPIKSRFCVINVEPENAEEEKFLLTGYTDRAGRILKACGISYDGQMLDAFVKANFPDMRSIINKIQQLHTRGVRELTQNEISATYDCASLFDMLLAPCDPVANYKSLMADWSNRVDDAIIQIGKEFPKYLTEKCPDKTAKLPLVVITTADYQAQLPQAIDKFVVLSALVFKLQMVLA